MKDQFLALCEELEKDIKDSYESSVTMEEAEKLAGKFLYAQLQVSQKLATTDLDARMRKSGLKAIKAAVYLDNVQGKEKKPSDTLLEQLVNSDAIVKGEQAAFDEAEVVRDQLQNYLNIFKEAHVHFRTIAKGRFE